MRKKNHKKIKTENENICTNILFSWFLIMQSKRNEPKKYFNFDTSTSCEFISTFDAINIIAMIAHVPLFKFGFCFHQNLISVLHANRFLGSNSLFVYKLNFLSIFLDLFYRRYSLNIQFNRLCLDLNNLWPTEIKCQMASVYFDLFLFSSSSSKIASSVSFTLSFIPKWLNMFSFLLISIVERMFIVFNMHSSTDYADTSFTLFAGRNVLFMYFIFLCVCLAALNCSIEFRFILLDIFSLFW